MGENNTRPATWPRLSKRCRIVPKTRRAERERTVGSSYTWSHVTGVCQSETNETLSSGQQVVDPAGSLDDLCQRREQEVLDVIAAQVVR